MVEIELSAADEARLDALARATGRTRAFHVREAVLDRLDDLEDLYVSERRLADNRAGRSRTFSLDEAARALDLDG